MYGADFSGYDDLAYPFHMLETMAKFERLTRLAVLSFSGTSTKEEDHEALELLVELGMI